MSAKQGTITTRKRYLQEARNLLGEVKKAASDEFAAVVRTRRGRLVRSIEYLADVVSMEAGGIHDEALSDLAHSIRTAVSTYRRAIES